MGSPDVGRAAAHWGDHSRAEHYAAGGVSWLHIPAVRRRLNAKITGDPERDWIDAFMGAHLRGRSPVERCLSLCCGTGQVERALVDRGACSTCLGVDASPGALDEARRLAEQGGHRNIEYAAQDVNSVSLPQGEFGLIVAHHALHHLEALEHVLDEVSNALAPGGLFVCLGYAGPDRFEHSDQRYEQMDAALHLLPAEYRRSVSFARSGRIGAGARRTPGMWARLLWRKLASGALWAAVTNRLRMRRLRGSGEALVKDRVPRIMGAEMAVDDPSEAVRSSAILPLLHERLEVIEEKPCGGGLLMWVLDDIAGNFGEDDPQAEELLRRLFEREDALMATGELTSDFVYLVGRRPVQATP